MLGCLQDSNNIKKCQDTIKSKLNVTDELAQEAMFYNGILPKRTNTFPGGIMDNDETTCIVPDKYLKNPPEKVDKPSTPPVTPPSPYIDPYSNLNNILNNIFNNKNFDINEYKEALKYLESIQPSDIKKFVSSYIQNIKSNNTYEDIRQNIIKIFNILNNNKETVDLTFNFSVDMINDLKTLISEINVQMALDNSQKFNLDINNIKNNLISKLKNSDNTNVSDKNNCKTFSTESIVVISILIFLLVIFILLLIFKKK